MEEEKEEKKKDGPIDLLQMSKWSSPSPPSAELGILLHIGPFSQAWNFFMIFWLLFLFGLIRRVQPFGQLKRPPTIPEIGNAHEQTRQSFLPPPSSGDWQ
jgi:hypothetical protein